MKTVEINYLTFNLPLKPETERQVLRMMDRLIIRYHKGSPEYQKKVLETLDKYLDMLGENNRQKILARRSSASVTE